MPFVLSAYSCPREPGARPPLVRSHYTNIHSTSSGCSECRRSCMIQNTDIESKCRNKVYRPAGAMPCRSDSVPNAMLTSSGCTLCGIPSSNLTSVLRACPRASLVGWDDSSRNPERKQLCDDPDRTVVYASIFSTMRVVDDSISCQDGVLQGVVAGQRISLLLCSASATDGMAASSNWPSG